MVTRLDPEQLARNEDGLAACRAVLAAAAARRQQPDEPDQPRTRSDELLAAAREQAARQRTALDRLRRQTPATRTKEPKR